MKTADEMLAFLRGRTEERFAACPLFTAVYTQALHRRDWLGTSEAPETIEDIVAVGRECGFVPLFEVLWFEVGTIDYDEVRDEVSGDTLDRVKTFRTPHGEFVLVDRFARYHSRSVARHAFTGKDLDAYEYVIARSLDRVEQCRPRLKAALQRAGNRAIPYFTAPSPHKCFNLISSVDRIYLFMDEPERMRRVCELNERLSRAAIRIAAQVGFQLFFSGLDASLYSPEIISEFSLPFLVERRRLIGELGGLFYQHECGKMLAALENGTYARISPDILEGFQPPPSGDIADMAQAARSLPPCVVTKGNLDLNFLLNASPQEVKESCLRIMEGIRGRRHIMSGACSALPGTPMDNFRAIVQAVEEANRQARANG